MFVKVEYTCISCIYDQLKIIKVQYFVFLRLATLATCNYQLSIIKKTINYFFFKYSNISSTLSYFSYFIFLFYPTVILMTSQSSCLFFSSPRAMACFLCASIALVPTSSKSVPVLLFLQNGHPPSLK